MIGFGFFDLGVVLQELEGVFEDQIFANIVDHSVLPGFLNKLLHQLLLPCGDVGLVHHELRIVGDDAFFLRDFSENEADLQAVARLLGGTAEDLVLLFDEFLLRNARLKGTRGNVIGATLGFAVHDFLRQIKLQFINDVSDDLVGLVVPSPALK